MELAWDNLTTGDRDDTVSGVISGAGALNKAGQEH